jgi:DNA-binding NtrC family response regulator
MPKVPLIAIVDDDDSLRSSLENLIRSFGFGVQAFPSAEAFLGWRRARDTACLILDVRMPGMNGLDLQRQMTRENWRVPIVFITSHADDHGKARALEDGAVAVRRTSSTRSRPLSGSRALRKPDDRASRSRHDWAEASQADCPLATDFRAPIEG